MLPIPTGENKVLAGTPVTAEQLAFLERGPTSQNTVLQQLGNPNVIWEDEKLFVYFWDVRQGVLFWAVYASGAGMTDIPKHYLLLIQFDDEERVKRFERTTRPPLKHLIDFLADWVKNTSEHPLQPPLTDLEK